MIQVFLKFACYSYILYILYSANENKREYHIHVLACTSWYSIQILWLLIVWSREKAFSQLNIHCPWNVSSFFLSLSPILPEKRAREHSLLTSKAFLNDKQKSSWSSEQGSYVDDSSIWCKLVEHWKISYVQITWPFLFSVHKMQSAGNRIFHSILRKKAYYIKTLWRGSTCLNPERHRASEKAGSCYTE